MTDLRLVYSVAILHQDKASRGNRQEQRQNRMNVPIIGYNNQYSTSVAERSITLVKGTSKTVTDLRLVYSVAILHQDKASRGNRQEQRQNRMNVPIIGYNNQYSTSVAERSITLVKGTSKTVTDLRLVYSVAILHQDKASCGNRQEQGQNRMNEPVIGYNNQYSTSVA